MIKKEKHWIHEIEAVGWDLDGTIYPPTSKLNDAIHRHKIQTVARHLNVSEEAAAARFAIMYEKHHSNSEVLDALGIDGQGFFLDTWNNLEFSEYIDANPALVSAFARLIKVSAIPQVMLTNSNTLETVLKKLTCIGLPIEYFTAIHTSVSLGVNKPNPRAFEPLHTIHATRPNQVLYVGDRIETDIMPAKKLGMRTALITNDQNEQEEHAQFVDIFSKDPTTLCNTLITLFEKDF